MLVVWGGIAIQIAGGFYEDESIAMPSVVNIENPTIQKDTFKYSLSLSYSDPFKISVAKKLNAESKSEKRISVNKNRKITAIKNNVPNTEWPDIKFGGTIKSSNDKVVGMLTISGKSYLVKVGQVLNDISIVQFSENDIVVKYKDETKTILK